MSGSVLDLSMEAAPDKNWGKAKEDRPAANPGKEAAMIPYLTTENRSFLHDTTVALACETKNSKIYYTTDGTEPTENSSLFTKPFTVDNSVTLKYKAYAPGLEPSITVTSGLEKATAIAASENVLPGIEYKYYDGVFRSIWDFEKETPEKEDITPDFNLDNRMRDEWFAMEFNGLVDIPEDGEYTFYLNSDDGGQLMINGIELFESDGRKEFAFEQHASVYLKKGLNEIAVKYFQCSDNMDLDVQWESSKIAKQDIPARVLFHKK